MRKLNHKKGLLHDDVKFPLSWDTDEYKMYIFDDEMHMIAQVDNDMDATINDHPFEKLIGGYKETIPTNERFKLVDGDFIDIKTDKVIGCVRSWGRLQYKKSPKPEKRQDNIAAYILNVLNS